MTARRRVLITGAAGRIGSVLTAGLADQYELALLDQRRAPGVRRVDLRRPWRLDRRFSGYDTVVHLAANASVESPWSVVLRENIPIDVSVLDAARRVGVRRVVLASSNHVTGRYEQEDPYRRVVAGEYEGLSPDAVPRLRSSDPVRPDGPYGVGKAMTEMAGRYYADAFGLSVLALRIGTVTDDGRPHTPRHFATLLSHGDLVRLIRGCIDAAPELRFGVYYGVSANRWRFWDLDDAAADIGFMAQDDAEHWRDAPGRGPT